MSDDIGPYLGPCCICETDAGVTNIVTLNRRGVVPGHGWGCVVCDLPADGASAVLCDTCVAEWQAGRAQLRYACRGYPGEDGRIAYEALSPEPFAHDMSKHGDVE